MTTERVIFMTCTVSPNKTNANIRVCFVGRGGRNRTRARGFGDPRTTIIRRPFVFDLLKDNSNKSNFIQDTLWRGYC